jgi:hypothetical protein
MAHMLRLPLLILLAGLTTAFLLIPSPANAEPSCYNGAGHYEDTACDELWQGSCRVGSVCFTYDCEWVDGQLAVQTFSL